VLLFTKVNLLSPCHKCIEMLRDDHKKLLKMINTTHPSENEHELFQQLETCKVAQTGGKIKRC